MDKKKWLIKNQKGLIQGPLSTLKVEELIYGGEIESDQLIAESPNGEWIEISKINYFYDLFLKFLEKKSAKNNTADSMEAETIIEIKNSNLEKANNKGIINLENKNINTFKNKDNLIKNEKDKKEIQVKLNRNTKPIQFDKKNDSTCSNEDLLSKSKTSLNKVFFIFLIGILIVVFSFLYEDPSSENNAENKIRLKAPKVKSEVSNEQVMLLNKQVIQLILDDSVAKYIEAQDKLVIINQSNFSSLESKALLCFVHKELWPFSFQDTVDLNAVKIAAQNTKSQDLTSPFGQFCDITKSMVQGQSKDAKSLIDSMLEGNINFSLISLLFFYKAEILIQENDIKSALLYFEKAKELWDWPKSSIKMVEIYLQQKEFLKARTALQEILKNKSNHKTAKLLSGILYFKGFKQSDEAYLLFNEAFKINDLVSKNIISESYYVIAQIFIEKGDQVSAKNYAQKAAYLNPSIEAYKELVFRLGGDLKMNLSQEYTEHMYAGDQFQRSGNCLAAQAEYKAAFEINPKSAVSSYKAAKCLWQLNQSFEAIDWLNKAIKSEPNFISAYVLQADYASQRYDFSTAGNILSKANRLSPKNYEVLRGLSLLEFRKNNMQSAIMYGEKAKAIFDGDIETYTTLSLSNLNLAISLGTTNKKELELKQKASQDALKYATKSIELDSMNSEAQITYGKVISAFNGIDYGVEHFQQLIQKYAYSIEYRLALADLYKSEDRFNQAKSLYEQVINIDSKNKKAFLGLAACFRALGLDREAEKAYLSAGLADPTDGEAIFSIGKMRLDELKPKEAMDLFKRVQKVNPYFPRTDYYIGKAALLAGDLNMAEDFAKVEKKKNPQLADSYILMAEVFSLKKLYSECASEYAQAMRLRNQSSDIYIKSAQCYRRSGALEIAEDMLALAKGRESGNAEIYKELSLIYEGRGNIKSAVEALLMYLKLSPNAHDYKQVELKLRGWGVNGPN